MSMQDDNLNNKDERNSAPESLGQVLNSLQSILDQKHFPFSSEQDLSLPIVDASEDNKCEEELFSFDADNVPVLETEERLSEENFTISSDDMDIPVLDDIIFKGLSDSPEQNNEIESQLTQLRHELDGIVGNIMDEARQKFESGEELVSTENSMQRFLRELSQK